MGTSGGDGTPGPGAVLPPGCLFWGAFTSALLPLFLQGLQSSLPSIREGRGTEQQLAQGVTQMEQQESSALAGGLALGQPFRTLFPSSPGSCGCSWTRLLASPPGAGLGLLIHFPWSCMVFYETRLGVPGTQVTLASPGVLY